MNRNSKHQHGFTLIELVIVIIVLSILTSMALLKFADLQETAKLAKLKGAYMSISSAALIAQSKFVMQGGDINSSRLSYINYEGISVAMRYGLPHADAVVQIAGLENYFTKVLSGGYTLQVYVEEGDRCYLNYRARSPSNGGMLLVMRGGAKCKL